MDAASCCLLDCLSFVSLRPDNALSDLTRLVRLLARLKLYSSNTRFSSRRGGPSAPASPLLPADIMSRGSENVGTAIRSHKSGESGTFCRSENIANALAVSGSHACLRFSDRPDLTKPQARDELEITDAFWSATHLIQLAHRLVLVRTRSSMTSPL